MKINVHAGHNPDGRIACGAVGYLKESTEARKVKKHLIKYLTIAGHQVHDCTINNGTSQYDVLDKIVHKCNSHRADLDVSIHLNSGAQENKSNGKTTGTECWIYPGTKTARDAATNICKHISKLGYANRGVKETTDLMVLNQTKAPAVLVECAFVDDKDDAKLWNSKKMGGAIAVGILNTFSVQTYRTKKKAALYHSTGIKTSNKLRKRGAKVSIVEFAMIKGKIMGKIKGTGCWIKISKLV